MNVHTPRIVTGMVVGTLWAASLSYSATPLSRPSGSIAGLVSDHTGVPQMGAVVLLFDHQERLLGKTLTNTEGAFGFAALIPDTYSIRVTLASFFPALKKNISVQPGMKSLLNVNLASVFSSIEVVYAGPGQVMSDEWKWVLRSAAATRPVMRFGPIDTAPTRQARRPAASVFSETRGLVRVSGGDEGRVSLLGSEPDLGTAFTLATSVLGHNQLQVSGNVGFSASTGMPSAGFRTSFRRESEGAVVSPEVKLTMRQLYLPGRVGSALLAGQQNNPTLRTLSVTTLDRVRLSDDLGMEYGFSLDSVTFLDRLNYFSPFARLTYEQGSGGEFQFSFFSGAVPIELLEQNGESDPGLQQDIAALSVFPRLSLRGGRPRVQRSESYELGYHKTLGSRTVELSAYSERMNNAAVTMFAEGGVESSPDLLPDLFSNSYVLNAGGYRSTGMSAALTQAVGDNLDFTMAYGNGGALMPESALPGLMAGPEQFREQVRTTRRHLVTAKVTGALPGTGTRFATSYQWASANSIMPSHMYLTQRLREGLGWNIRIHQPIPYFPGWAGRLEATAELRNMLAQGYVPLANGPRRVFLVQAPRSFRGGLSFIF